MGWKLLAVSQLYDPRWERFFVLNLIDVTVVCQMKLEVKNQYISQMPRNHPSCCLNMTLIQYKMTGFQAFTPSLEIIYRCNM